MKKLTISGIKEILKVELEKSKRHVQHYYLGTNRFSETDRLKSLLNNQEQEEQSRQDLKQNYRQTLKRTESQSQSQIKVFPRLQQIDYRRGIWICWNLKSIYPVN